MRWTGWLLTALGAGGILWALVMFIVRGYNAGFEDEVMFAQALLVSGAILLAAGLATLSFGGCCGWCGDEDCGCGCPDCQGEACCGKCACCADDGNVRPVH